MQMRIIITFLFLCLSTGIFAQKKGPAINLIPNPGFEQFSSPPIGWFYRGSDFTSLMRFWDSPTNASPDAYGQNIRVPAHWKSNGFHLQKAHKGESMIGLTMYGCENGKPHCREYVQIRLNEELVIGQNYYVEFYVSKLKNGMASNNFGLAFSIDPVRLEIDQDIEIDPLFNDVRVIDNEDHEWVKVRGGFQADSAYNFLIVGNFYKDIDTKVEKTNNQTLNYSYYYFDDFLVKKIPPILDVPEEKEDLRKQVLTEGKIIKLKNIYFDFDKWDLHPRSFIELNKLISVLEKNPGMNIQIHGHTDSIGSDNYNIYLSRKRAKSVISYLSDNGIDVTRLSYKAYGSSEPVESNKDSEGRALNRRVEFKILNIK